MTAPRTVLPPVSSTCFVERIRRLHVLNSIMGHNVTFDVVVVPGGGETQADEYLASAAETFGDGKAEITNEDHKGQPFRGLRIRQPKGLSEDPEAFVEHYTTVYEGDMIAFSLGILGPISAAIAGVRHLMFTIVYAALIRSASAR